MGPCFSYAVLSANYWKYPLLSYTHHLKIERKSKPCYQCWILCTFSLSHTHTREGEVSKISSRFFYVIIDINIGIIYDKKARLDRFFGKLLSSNYLIQNHCFISCPHMQISECVNRIQTYRLIATQLHNPLHEFRVWNILSCIFHWLFKETFKLISCPLKSKSEKHLSRWLKQNYWWL